MPSVIALVPARSGSERVPDKNIRPLAGHPLLAYAIATAQQSACSSASSSPPTTERPPTSPAGTAPTSRSCGPPSIRDVDLAGHRVDRLHARAPARALRPVRDRPGDQPVPRPGDVRRGLEQLLATPEADSIRAVELVKQHPGRCGSLRRSHDAAAPRPVSPRRRVARRPVPGPAARLPPEQRARDRLDARRHRDGHARGRVLAPFLTEGLEGFNIDDEADWERAEALVARGEAALPEVGRPPFA